MKKHARFLALAFLGSAIPLSAQNLVVTNTTSITESPTNNYSSIFIGQTNASSPSGQLTVSNGAALRSTARIVLGDFSGNTGNTLTVDGAGSMLTSRSSTSSRLFVGNQGGSASVLVTNGGRIAISNTTTSVPVLDAVLALGVTSEAASNSVVVAGTGSTLHVNHGGTDMLLTNTPINIGTASAGNQLVVKDGAIFNASRFLVQLGASNTSTGNSMIVSGGALATNFIMVVGWKGSGNTLSVLDGGKLETLTDNYGFWVSRDNATGSNTALISGAGSEIKNPGLAVIGDTGVGHLVISNGGSMTTSTTSIGLSTNTAGSSLLITGPGSFLSVVDSATTFSQGTLSVGGAAGSARVTISNGGALTNTSATIGSGANGNGNAVLVDGGTWDSGVGLNLGTSGDNNSLVVTNGGLVVSALSLEMAYFSNSYANSILVTGPGSRIQLGTSLNVGRAGSTNSFTVENGGLVSLAAANQALVVGRDSNAVANTFLVTGAGSVISNAGTTHVGLSGSGNSLAVSNGGSLLSAVFMVSSNSTANNNSALVTGAGSVISNSTSSRIGVSGSGTLNVSNNGVFHAGGSLQVATGSAASTDGSAWIGQGRASVQSINVLHANAASNSVVTVNGLLQAATNVSVGGRGIVLGTGTISAPTVSILNGGTIAPGASPGTLTINGDLAWQSGGNYNWELFNATGVAGATTGWDLLSVSGALDLSGLGVGSEFKINLWSLSALPQTSGNATNFVNTTNYTWTIITATNGITGFNANKFLINSLATNGTGGFANALAPGWGFSLAQDGNNLNLVYGQLAPEPVPEPGTWAAAALLAGGAAFMRWRKRAKGA